MQLEEFLVAKKRTVIVSGLSCCGATSYLHRMSVCTLEGVIHRELVLLCLYSNTFSQDLSKNAPFVSFTDREQLRLTECTREIIKKATTCSITLPTTVEGRDESMCVCVCGGYWEVQTKGLWNIWMQVIALLTRVTSQINQTWWGDWCVSLKRIKSQSTSCTSLALTYSHPERTQGW